MKSFEIQKKYMVLLAVCGLLVSVDQASKMWIHTNFVLGEEHTLISHLFSFTYVRNYGAAFGFMREFNEGFRNLFFTVLPPMALLVILALLRGVPYSDKATVYSLSSIFAGAIGNYIDRMRFGYVIDFLDFYVPRSWFSDQIAGTAHWPAFNVADMAIVCGISVLLLLEWLKYLEVRKSQTKVR